MIFLPARPAFRSLLLLCATGLALPAARAQIALSTAANLALKNSPKVKLAQSDVDKARAVLSQTRDAFIPAVLANGGIGKSTGAPLSPPVVFSIAAQSLVYNAAQSDYIHAAHAGVESAQLALDAVRSDTVEDTTSTFIALDNALQRRVVEAEALGFAQHLVAITQDRVQAGVDAHIELTRARQTEAQIRLGKLLIEDDISAQADHLARLTGLVAPGLTTDHGSIPALQAPSPQGGQAPESSPQQLTGVSAAFAAARAKAFTAKGERHSLLLPQIAFSASYSRISTVFTTYTQYYPAFGQAGNSFNSLNFGVEISIPLLDMVHRAKAREAAADAAHSLYDAQAQSNLFLESRNKLRHSAAELDARRELAGLDRELAQDQLDAILIRLRANAGAVGGEQLTPRDEQNARLQERLRALDLLNANLQLQQAEVSLLRQEGSLASWLTAIVPGAAAAPADASPTQRIPQAPTVGTTPGIQPSGSLPAVPPTVGTPPATLPASPVTNPAPSNPISAPPATPHP